MELSHSNQTAMLSQLMSDVLAQIENSAADQVSIILYFAGFAGFTVALIFLLVRDRHEFPAFVGVVVLYVFVKLFIGGRAGIRRRKFVEAAAQHGISKSAAMNFWKKYWKNPSSCAGVNDEA